MAEYTIDDLIEAMQYIDSQNIQTITDFIEYSKIYNREKWLSMIDNPDYYASLLQKLNTRKKGKRDQKEVIQFISKQDKNKLSKELERTRERIKVLNDE